MGLFEKIKNTKKASGAAAAAAAAVTTGAYAGKAVGQDQDPKEKELEEKEEICTPDEEPDEVPVPAASSGEGGTFTSSAFAGVTVEKTSPDIHHHYHDNPNYNENHNYINIKIDEKESPPTGDEKLGKVEGEKTAKLGENKPGEKSTSDPTKSGKEVLSGNKETPPPKPPEGEGITAQPLFQDEPSMMGDSENFNLNNNTINIDIGSNGMSNPPDHSEEPGGDNILGINENESGLENDDIGHFIVENDPNSYDQDNYDGNYSKEYYQAESNVETMEYTTAYNEDNSTYEENFSSESNYTSEEYVNESLDYEEPAPVEENMIEDDLNMDY